MQYSGENSHSLPGNIHICVKIHGNVSAVCFKMPPTDFSYLVLSSLFKMLDKYPAIPSNFKPTIYEVHLFFHHPILSDSWMMVKGQTTWRGTDSGYIVLSTRYTIKDDETLCRMNHLAGLLLGKDTVLNND